MRRGAFYLHSESHSRWFAPALRACKHKPIVYYPGHGIRNGLMRGVISDIDVEYRQSKLIWGDILDTDWEIVVPLYMGTPPTKTLYFGREYPRWQEIDAADFSQLRSRIVVMHEEMYCFSEGYRPWAHVFLAKNQAEADEASKRFGGHVELMGDTFLDRLQPIPHKDGTCAFTTLHDWRKKPSHRLMRRLMPELIQGIRDGMLPEPVFLKEHPRTTGQDHGDLEPYKKMLQKASIPFTVLSQNEPMEKVARRVSHAFVTDSPSSLFMLHRLGVETYHYFGECKHGPHKGDFLLPDALKPPVFEFSNRCPVDEFDRWLTNTFRLDGNSNKRLLSVLECTNEA